MKQDEQIQEIALSEISLDRETQIRETISEETVQRYFDMMENEAGRSKFPPIILIRDEVGKYWLADGHHRVAAAIRRKFASIRAIIRPGTKADAIWEAAESNARNGLPIFGTDYRRAVTVLAEAYPDRSNVMIADVLRCSEKTVRKYRPAQSGSDPSEPVKRTGKDGKSYPAKKQKKSVPKTKVISSAKSSKPIQKVQADTATPKDSSKSIYAFSETPLRKLYGHYDQEVLAKDLVEAFSPFSVSGLPFAIFEELSKNPKDKKNIERMMHNFINGYIIRHDESQYKPLLVDLFSRMFGDDELVDKIMELVEKEEKNYAL